MVGMNERFNPPGLALYGGLSDDQLGFSLKPPKWLRKASVAIRKNVTLKRTLEAGAVVGAAFFAPAAVGLLARGVVAGGKFLAPAATSLFRRLERGAAGGAPNVPVDTGVPGATAPTGVPIDQAPSGGAGVPYGGGAPTDGGGGGSMPGAGPVPSQMSEQTPVEASTSGSGMTGLIVAGVGLIALMSIMKKKRR
jgi:hypothetical protein